MIYIHLKKYSVKHIAAGLFVMAFFTVFLQKNSIRFCPEIILEKNPAISDRFRQMNMPLIDIEDIRFQSKKYNISTGEYVGLLWCGQFEKTSENEEKQIKRLDYLYRYKQKDNFEVLANVCSAIFEDIKFFPVAKCLNGDKEVSYVDSWYGERNYGGNRRHEGTDIMASVNERGIYPVISMTDGIVENAGWLKLGGYRIGIRSPNGGYFYYAHLSSYSREYKAGDNIKAGEVIGYMGDSGYGEEGTVGKFAVHLHLGIYVNDSRGNEISINPYNVLNMLTYDKKVMDY